MRIIEGISNLVFKEIQSKTNHSTTRSVAGSGFIESLNNIALSSQMVVRGSQLSSAGLHEQKMVKDWIRNFSGEEEETIDDIFAKIARIDEILKEKFSR